MEMSSAGAQLSQRDLHTNGWCCFCTSGRCCLEFHKRTSLRWSSIWSREPFDRSGWSTPPRYALRQKCMSCLIGIRGKAGNSHYPRCIERPMPPLASASWRICWVAAGIKAHTGNDETLTGISATLWKYLSLWIAVQIRLKLWANLDSTSRSIGCRLLRARKRNEKW